MTTPPSYVRSAAGDVAHLSTCPRVGALTEPLPMYAGQTVAQVLVEIGKVPWLRACSRCLVATDLTRAEQLELGRDLRDAGTAVADDAARLDWKQQVDRAIDLLAASGQTFTADDLRDLGVDDPASPKAWGARFLAASKAGRIVRVGYTPSRRASVHAHPVALWLGADHARAAGVA